MFILRTTGSYGVRCGFRKAPSHPQPLRGRRTGGELGKAITSGLVLAQCVAGAAGCSWRGAGGLETWQDSEGWALRSQLR